MKEIININETENNGSSIIGTKDDKDKIDDFESDDIKIKLINEERPIENMMNGKNISKEEIIENKNEEKTEKVIGILNIDAMDKNKKEKLVKDYNEKKETKVFIQKYEDGNNQENKKIIELENNHQRLIPKDHEEYKINNDMKHL